MRSLHIVAAVVSLTSTAVAQERFLWADVDGDGIQDLTWSHPFHGERLLFQTPGEGLVDATERLGLAGLEHSDDSLWVDVDGDGRPDLVRANRGAGPRVLANREGGFEDVTELLGLADLAADAWSWFDGDGDGLPELFGTTEAGAVLFANRGGEWFERVAGLQALEPATAHGVALAATEALELAPEDAHAPDDVPAAPRGTAAPGPPGSLRRAVTAAGSAPTTSANATSIPTGLRGSGTRGWLPWFVGPRKIGDSALFQNLSGYLGLGTTTPTGALHLVGGPVDILNGQTTALAIQGDGVDGQGGRILFGDGLGGGSMIVQDFDDQLKLLAPAGIGMGPGSVSIQTTETTHALTVGSVTDDAVRLVGTQGSFGHGARLAFGDIGYAEIEEFEDDRLRVYSHQGTRFEDSIFNQNPTVSIETTRNLGSGAGALRAENFGTIGATAITAQAWGTGTAAQINNRSTGPHIACSPGGGLNVFEVLNDGEVVCKSVTITGGSDVVEAFDTIGAAPEPGAVLAIDPAAPGKLRVASGAYDPRVAGVVSGAGGVHPGIELAQAGKLEGDTPVAISGRVYVRCTDENGPIEPGDLVTTSSIPGHAMRATDRERAFGAVLGKALGRLNAETGLVLVLVNLQ